MAALGPRMLDLARERTAGTHLYFVPVEHTRFARERLRADKLVMPELACVVENDPVRAKAVAREYARRHLDLRNYRQNLLDLASSRRPARRLRPTARRPIQHGSSDQIAEASTRTLTPAPTTCACNRWAKKASPCPSYRARERPGRLEQREPAHS